ncbi:MAG: 16S rRNA (cytidine(1402)-2'-O)-methyltransferase [Acidimicrobiales bacterium]|nr:16S rRNA (cytidine(1402)-2'-O)-methyltransferase [Acidimicrobiales bacterium]
MAVADRGPPGDPPGVTGSGRFVVIGTPIGNLDDLSPRAARALTEADVVCCEDTRRTRKLFSALSIPTPRLVRLDQHNEAAMSAPVLEALASGESVALVTDAGMPGISDPGDRIVKAVADAGYPPEVVPGPSAVSAALAVSGLPASRYLFAGFLPRKGRDRTARLEELAATAVTVVIYEAPIRVARTVADLVAVCGPDRAFVATRELTKVHEETWRGPLGGAAEWLAGRQPRGEWVLLLGPLPVRGRGSAEERAPLSQEEISVALDAKLASGADRRRAVAEVASEMSVPKRQVYDVAVELKGQR